MVKNYYRVKFYKQTKVETTIKTIGDNLVVDESKTIGGINTQSALPIFSTSTIENQMYKAKSDFPLQVIPFTHMKTIRERILL